MSRRWFSTILFMAAFGLVPGLVNAQEQSPHGFADRYEAERLRAESQGGHDYSPLELQTRFIDILGNPKFRIASDFLTKRGFVLKWSEMEGGGVDTQGAENLKLLSIPFAHHAGKRHGFLIVKNDEWRILMISPQEEEEGTEFRGYAIEDAQGKLALRNSPDVIPAEPEHGLEELVGKAWKSMTCAYVEKVKVYWACFLNDPQGNPFGYQYNVRFREGLWWNERPTRVSWYACWYGSMHTCPYKQTKTYTFPICGIPPRHSAGG
jgi:hypothetical protein